MLTKRLAEAVILQSMEDLWDVRYRADSLRFFSGQYFRTCAKTAGMGIEEKLKLLSFIKNIIDSNGKSLKKTSPFKTFSTSERHKSIDF